MPTQPYLIDGVRVPSVTTILSNRKNCDGLVYWAWDLGKQGKDYRQVRDSAATAGTIAHNLIEGDIRGYKVDLTNEDPELVAQAMKAYGAYDEWKRVTTLTPTHTEMPLVSKKYRYGGTLDAMLIQGRLSVGDWKTSNSIYIEYLMQIAAYKQLWEENFPDQPIEGGLHLLRVSKGGDFHHHWWPELDDAWEDFLHLRAVYDLDKKLKGRL